MTNIKKHYAKRGPEAQGDHYINHVSAMTTEGLHAKSAIAAELAHRGIEIERLRAALAAPVQSDLIAIRKPTTRAEAEWLAKLAHLLVSDVNSTLEGLLATDSTAAPAQAGEYPELPVPWRIGAGGVEAEAYSASQMRAYVDADRAARKPLADGVLHALYADAMAGHFVDALHYWRGTPAHRFARSIEKSHGITAAPKRGQDGTE